MKKLYTTGLNLRQMLNLVFIIVQILVTPLKILFLCCWVLDCREHFTLVNNLIQ